MKEFERKVIELWQEMARGQGLKDDLLIQLFALLYLEPEPVSMNELAKKTGYSLASVSNKVRMLAPLLRVRIFRKPGSKKLYIYMEKDILKIWQQALLKKEQFVVNTAKGRIPGLIKEFKNKAVSDKDKKKIEVLSGYYKQVLKFELVLKKIVEEIEKAMTNG
jgi:DNA-binding transcriptional regulator GbsR (MarR family)